MKTFPLFWSTSSFATPVLHCRTTMCLRCGRRHRAVGCWIWTLGCPFRAPWSSTSGRPCYPNTSYGTTSTGNLSVVVQWTVSFPQPLFLVSCNCKTQFPQYFVEWDFHYDLMGGKLCSFVIPCRNCQALSGQRDFDWVWHFFVLWLCGWQTSWKQTFRVCER